MVRAGKEDPELNMLVGRPDRRVGRRSFLQVAGLLAAAGMDLDLEVTADGLPAGDALLVDEVVVRQG